MKHAFTALCILVLAGTLSAFGQQLPKPAAATPPPQPNLPASTQPAPMSGADITADYILGTDDTIHVDVWKEPTISGPLTIRPDGKITLPLCGDIMASGLTPMALAAVITEKLKETIVNPTVTVTVTAANSKRIFFIGEVLRAGPISMTREMTMLQAISAAGGLTPYADKRHIYILRGDTGKQQKLPFDYSRALKKGDEQGIVLAPGDTVVVP
jgi:polysaccharide export outer membrane protein